MNQLGRRVDFDDRSRNYPIRMLVEPKPLRSYTWSCGQWLNQGAEGSCVGHAWAHDLIARPAVVGNITQPFARNKIYWEAQKIDPWPGGAYPGASPFYEGTSVLAGAKVVLRMGAMKEYRWAFGLNDLLLAIGYAGPAVLGLNWYEGMMTTDASGFVRPTGSLVGGHAILANGVSITKRLVRLHNSWGKRWGQAGDAFITFSDLERLLHEEGEACIPVNRLALVP